MSTGADDFLKDLQKQCLVDSKEYVDTMLESLAQLPGPFGPVLKTFEKSLHSLKGNVQVSGFLDLARYLHDCESALGPIDEAIHNKSSNITEDLERALEFFLSEMQQSIAQYLDQLSVTLVDGPQMYQSFAVAITNLNEWTKSFGASVPTITASDNPAAAHVITNTKLESKTNLTTEVETTAHQKTRSATTSTGISAVGDESKQILVKDTYMLFSCSEQLYAVDVNHIVEVVTLPPVIRLPIARKDIRGLVNLRGATVPVLALEKVWGKLANSKYLVICERDGNSFGFEVEQAREVLHILPDAMMPLTTESSGDPKIGIHRVAKVGERKALIFDLAGIVAA